MMPVASAGISKPFFRSQRVIARQVRADLEWHIRVDMRRVLHPPRRARSPAARRLAMHAREERLEDAQERNVVGDRRLRWVVRRLKRPRGRDRGQRVLDVKPRRGACRALRLAARAGCLFGVGRGWGVGTRAFGRDRERGDGGRHRWAVGVRVGVRLGVVRLGRLPEGKHIRVRAARGGACVAGEHADERVEVLVVDAGLGAEHVLDGDGEALDLRGGGEGRRLEGERRGDRDRPS
jgi:hypothetical protein